MASRWQFGATVPGRETGSPIRARRLRCCYGCQHVVVLEMWASTLASRRPVNERHVAAQSDQNGEVSDFAYIGG